MNEYFPTDTIGNIATLLQLDNLIKEDDLNF